MTKKKPERDYLAERYARLRGVDDVKKQGEKEAEVEEESNEERNNAKAD